jgi:hypothetical protein
LAAVFTGQRQVGALRSFTDADMSQLLNGYEKDGRWVAGLVELNVVWVVSPVGRGVLVVGLSPDCSTWRCKPMHTRAAREEWLAEVDAQTAEYDRQSLAGEIEERFCLATMLPWNALDVVLSRDAHQDDAGDAGMGMNDVRPSRSGRKDALKGERTMGMNDVRPSCAPRDARSGSHGADESARFRVPAPSRDGTLEIPKRERAGNRGDFGNSEVSRPRAVKQEQVTEAVKQLNSSTVQQRKGGDDSNRLLAELEEQFARVHGDKEARCEMVNSGGAWRLVARRWPQEFEQQVGGLRVFLNEGGKVDTTAWFYVQFYFKRAVGLKSWADVCAEARRKKI